MLRWILLLAFFWIAFVAGSKLASFSQEEWRYLIRNHALPPSTGKNLLGGILAAFSVLVPGKYLLRIRQPISDSFAFVLPWGIVIQRIGCFLTGCCHGTPANLPWSVCYPTGSLAHFHHFERGMIGFPDSFSLPVHPVQLYETAGCLLILFLLIRLGKHLKASGSLLLLSLVLLCAEHFMIEFFRDPAAHTSVLRTEGTISQLQGILLTGAIVLSLLIYVRESRSPEKKIPPDSGAEDMHAPAIQTLLWIFLFGSLRTWFTPAEFLSLLWFLPLIISFWTIRIIKGLSIRTIGRQLAAVTFPLLLMAQTYPQTASSPTFSKQHKTFRIGIASGDYYNSHTYGQGEGCDRVHNTNYFRQKYTLGGAGFSVTNENPVTHDAFQYGIKAFLGRYQETRISDNITKQHHLWGITPNLNFESQWLGLGGGIQFGELSFTTENLQDEKYGFPQTGSVRTKVYPQLSLRLGPRKWFYADFRLGDHFPSALPGYRYMAGIGTGFGQENGSSLRAGYTGNGIVLTGCFPLEKTLILEPLLIFNEKPDLYYDDSQTASVKSGVQFSLGVGYRFGYATRK